MPQIDDPPPHALRRYWRRNLMLIGVLLGIWLLLTFVPAYFARELTFDFIGWPFAFWMAAYGAPLCYLVLVVLYARFMNKADARLADEEKRSD
ncbi:MULTISPECIES: DUF4212 domain-containing protein [unclassified Bordetella]|uniref:DUF4212 domain-containing protein n=1 Tax=unclassified Bordetella TaxID=2630031 RepID=UPI0013213AD2|nr:MULTISPECIES: DUF4212 domain-containing protein [unclassified Bordetella]MVW73566.1 DUF4212 domain-containing protein [Bordetella sp. 15P40C-2]MVW77499.1 DUF4212 domain-containing protein [Bordetella sp. 02P26C-1]